MRQRGVGTGRLAQDGNLTGAFVGELGVYLRILILFK